MEFKLLQPYDKRCPEIDREPVDRLRDRGEFKSDTEWAIYEAKVFYEVFGDLRKATDTLEAQLKNAPNDPRLHFCLAECYSRIPGKASDALAHCDTGLQSDPDSDYAYTIMARVQLALQRPIEAYLTAMKALKINSRNFEAGVYLGTVGFSIAHAEGDEQEMKLSIENLKTTLSLNPGSQQLAAIIEENERLLRKMSGD